MDLHPLNVCITQIKFGMLTPRKLELLQLCDMVHHNRLENTLLHLSGAKEVFAPFSSIKAYKYNIVLFSYSLASHTFPKFVKTALTPLHHKKKNKKKKKSFFSV